MAVPRVESWQDEAWGHYDDGAEVWYASEWFGNGLSRARLVAAKRPVSPGDEPEVVHDGRPAELVSLVAGGVTGQSAMLQNVGVHLQVPGDSYVTAQTDATETSWMVLSPDEVQVDKAGGVDVWKVQTEENVWVPLPVESHVIRVWRPHKRRHWQADSPVRHALATLRELRHASEHIDASLLSRLSGFGLFLYPSEAVFPVKEKFANEPDPFAAEFMEVAQLAIKNRGSAAARIPLFTQMKGELIGLCRHMMFESPLDDKAIALREAAIRRYATAADMPGEVLLGVGDINHWGQWFIEDSAIKMNFVPALELIVDALTRAYLRPMLEAEAATDGNREFVADEWMVWFDTSEMTANPDRSDDAIALYDRLEINGAALRRETGLDEADAPTDEEVAALAARKLLTSPLTAIQGLQLLGIDASDLTPPASAPVAAAPPSPNGQGEGPPVGEEQPEATQQIAASVIAAAYPIVHRALEVAGNRARSKLGGAQKLSGSPADCAPELMHTCADPEVCGGADFLLAGAWDKVPTLAGYLGVDPEDLTLRLDTFARTLLARRTPLSREALEAALT
jgi:hypothetical protein